MGRTLTPQETELIEFAKTHPDEEVERLVKSCDKTLIKCGITAWFECTLHGRYWVEKLNGCTRPFQNVRESQATKTQMDELRQSWPA